MYPKASVYPFVSLPNVKQQQVTYIHITLKLQRNLRKNRHCLNGPKTVGMWPMKTEWKEVSLNSVHFMVTETGLSWCLENPKCFPNSKTNPKRIIHTKKNAQSKMSFFNS